MKYHNKEKNLRLFEFSKTAESNKPCFQIYKNAQPNIQVVEKDSLEACQELDNPFVLIFASAKKPGGGVRNGANAQEECLCRCSGLYFILNTQIMRKGFYEPHKRAHNPIHNDDIIYTPEVTVFKSDTASPTLLAEKDWYDVDVITCAAPNLRENPGNKYNQGDGNKRVKLSDKELLQIHEKRLKRILDVAVSKGDEVIILGAFGCGAFMNKTEIVALAAKNVVKEYLKAFKVVEFAVYCSPRDDENYKTFDRVLSPLIQ